MMEYCQCAADLPTLAYDVMGKLVDVMKVNNVMLHLLHRVLHQVLHSLLPILHYVCVHTYCTVYTYVCTYALLFYSSIYMDSIIIRLDVL